MKSSVHWKLLFVPLLVIGLAGCEALKSGAPPINPEMTRAAAANGDSMETLSNGRRLLAQRCTNCHGLEPIVKYTPEEWRTNVHRMADRAGLSEGDVHQVTSYLVAARESLE